jgi:hypothetical protein
MNDEKKNEQVEEVSVEELENVTGGLGFPGMPGFPGFPGLPPLIWPPVWGTKPNVGYPRILAALPSDLVELVESMDASETVEK